jgi:3,4-dihydroxy 2-butanone 4-phosphate synthase
VLGLNLIEKAGELLKKGKPVLIHDSSSRENEVDMVFHASLISYKSIAVLRKLAGGLICFSMPKSIGEKLGLRYMDDILREVGYKPLTTKVLGYGDPPNFSLWVNHKDVITGIRDSDRAKTIKELDRVVKLVIENRLEDAKSKLYEEFISPGHVPILLGRGLNNRRGHTELSLALAELNSLRPTTVIAEMLDEGGALSVDKAAKLAEKLGTVLIESDEILKAWFTFQKFSYPKNN